MIKLSKLNKYYFKNKPNEIHVLNDISLEFEDKGFVTILGPSGSGKSTLLNVIGGLDNAKGKICYEDLDLNKISIAKMDEYRNKNIGYIFQNYNLIHELSVYENIKLQLDLVGVTDPEEVETRINNSLKVVGMDKYKRRMVTALSGGQQQRVAIARALVKGSKVIIADEPTGNLDTKNSLEVMNLLKILSKRCLIVLVTHNPEYAYHYADRIIKLKDGVIIEDSINENTDSLLDTNSSNSIYLDQFTSNKNDNIEVFTKNNEKIKLRIIFDGVNLYIENNTDAVIKIIGDDTDKVLVEKTPETKELELKDKTEVDFSVVENNKSFKNRVRSLSSQIKNSFLNFFFTKGKSLLLNLSFFLIGFILCVCACFLSYSTYIEESVLENDPVEALRIFPSELGKENEYGVTFNYEELQQIVETDNGISSLVDKYDRPTFRYTFIGQRQILMDLKDNCYMTTPSMIGYDIDLKGNEMVISDVVADLLITYLKNLGFTKYSDLIGLEMHAAFGNVLNQNIIIKDVIDLDNKTFLVSEFLFYSYRTVPRDDKIKYGYLGEGKVLPNLITNDEKKDDTAQPIYVSKNLEKVYYDNKHNDVLGYFDSEDFEVVFPNKWSYVRYLSELQFIGGRPLPYDGTEIIEGNAPVNRREIALPNFMKDVYKIGSEYTLRNAAYKVTGYFDYEKSYIENVFTTEVDAYLERLSYVYQSGKGELKDSIDFYVTDKEKAMEYFKECGYNSYFVKDYVLKDATISKQEASKIAIVISLVIVVVMILFIFFISRSRMLKKVYTIGVYRALGSNKSKIIGKYVIDGIVMATCTAVLGFIIMYAFSIFGSKYLPGLTFDIKYFFLIIIGIYLVMVGAFILPVHLLLRRTPIEILVKYDI